MDELRQRQFNDKLKHLQTIPGCEYKMFKDILKPQFSIPLTSEYIDKINIGIKECKTKEDKKEWDVLIKFQSEYPLSVTVGRQIKFLVINNTDNTVIGMIRLCSCSRRSPLDNLIKWTNEVKYDQGLLQRIANAQALVPTQPFGYNCLGGKLLANLTTSRELLDMWNRRYESLYGIVTLSVRSGCCQYTGLKTFYKMNNIVKKNVGIERGVYFCELYKNTFQLLRNESILPIGNLKSVKQISDEWKVIAKKRLLKLIDENKLKTEPDCYDKYYKETENPFFD